MSSVPSSQNPDDLIVVPESLKKQLADFRWRVWSSKILEALVFSMAALTLSFLSVYVLDRCFDTPSSLRGAMFGVSILAWIAIPYALHRWVWRNRRFEQLARLLRSRDPIGDRLLSVLELAENRSEQSRSRTLCAAAIGQVAESARGRDLNEAAPGTWLRPLGWLLGAAASVLVVLSLLFPAAVRNAWARFVSPWNSIPRYTFTLVQPLADELVVAHGEATPFTVKLQEGSSWTPELATLRIVGLPPLDSQINQERRLYQFELPATVTDTEFRLVVGDYYKDIALVPKTRPELIGAEAEITLPEYLQRGESITQDVRSGTLIAVRGSVAKVHATASRDLESATVNSVEVTIDDSSFASSKLPMETDDSSLTMKWVDHDGLAGREPFELGMKVIEDESPSVLTQDFPRDAVVLDTEQINFQALAADDFGIRKIGMEWRSLDDTLAETVEGQKVIAGGAPTNTSMQVPSTFCAKSLGIEPQPIEVRLWVEDYCDRPQRSYSAPHVLFVLTAEQHAIWVTDQLSKWHRASLDVRDKELQLNAANKRLRSLDLGELAREDRQKELQRQASLEAANGRRLSSLAKTGEGLLRQAARNPEIGVGHLDRWAEMLQVLNDIGNNRMPAVSNLLGKAAMQSNRKPGKPQGRPGQGGDSQPKEQMPSVGQNRNEMAGGSGKSQPKAKDFADAKQVPKISDVESSMQTPGKTESDDQPGKEKKGNGAKLSLPSTTLVGPSPKSKPNAGEDQNSEQQDEAPLDEALFEQEKLLAEFEKISDDMNAVLANLEGSTLVKRLKAASRQQDQVAGKIGSEIGAVFGVARLEKESTKETLRNLRDVEQESSQQISYIMDDMQSYFERRRMDQFRVVLDDMKESDVLVALQDLGDSIPSDQGISIAEAEYWSDTIDRWAEDLVDPAESGQCPGSKTSDSLPPSVILAVLKVLEAEVNLREETRVAEQAKPVLAATEHASEAVRLSRVQSDLRSQLGEVVSTIEQLPKSEERFGKEIGLLTEVTQVMAEATTILRLKDTGAPAIAAETEVIELLLQSKRINPKGGGGGGSSPGGGGKGETQDSALALLGSGLNQSERREARDVTQATGEKGRVLPEEYRAGLDKYFELIDATR
ncbi:MAG: hypothetical protein ACE361_22120 [Aureliella sp.]